jgi:hypothetical protein
MGNGRNITLTRSHIANIWTSGQDSQAFCAWDGAGPYTVTDNYLEAASENVMFGGANSSSVANIPADILVENNHFSKPLEWKGQPRTVKNLFELKSAKRVIVRNNLFERNWTDAQNGYSILFTTRNDEGQSPWSVVEDVLFERNVVRDVENGFNVNGYDSYQASGRTTRVTIRNNLVITAGTFRQRSGRSHRRPQHGRPGLFLHDALQRRGVGRRHERGAARPVRSGEPDRHQHAREPQRVWGDGRSAQLHVDEQRSGRRQHRHSISADNLAPDGGRVSGAVQ